MDLASFLDYMGVRLRVLLDRRLAQTTVVIDVDLAQILARFSFNYMYTRILKSCMSVTNTHICV